MKVSSKPSDTLDQDGISLSDALQLYLKLKGQEKKIKYSLGQQKEISDM